MAARSQHEAVETYLGPLRRAVSCVSNAVLVQAYGPPDQPQFVAFADNPVRLRGNPPLTLLILHAFAVARGSGTRAWSVNTAGYRYELRNLDGNELVAYHWHPTGSSPITLPHLHVGSQAGRFDLSRMHLPTGFVTLAALLRCLIVDFGVQPLRPDWSAILDSSMDDSDQTPHEQENLAHHGSHPYLATGRD